VRTPPSAPPGHSYASALLRRLGFRYGISLGLVVVVIVVIVVARAVNHSTGSLVRPGADAGLVPSTSPIPDDGVASVPALQPPSTSPGAATPQTVATRFAKAWLRHTGVTAAAWRSSLTALSTDRLDGELADADPQTVPADRITGSIALTDHVASFVEADVPTDGGTLTLSLLATGGRWQVDAIDWEPA
jgi:hypothetical protein